MMKYDAQRFSTEIETIASDLVETLKCKNADYGNNVDKNIDEWGLSSLAIRLDDKLSRFKNLIKESNTRQVSDETIEDTLLDLAGYAILGYRKMREMNIVDKLNAVPLNALPNAHAVYTPIPSPKPRTDPSTFTFNP